MGYTKDTATVVGYVSLDDRYNRQETTSNTAQMVIPVFVRGIPLYSTVCLQLMQLDTFE